MTDETPKPKRKRWRWIIAGVLLFVAALSGWWNWPRGDARFVGKWEFQYLGAVGGVWPFNLELKPNGIAVYQKATASRPTYTRWAVEGDSLLLGTSPRPAGSPLNSLASLLSRCIGVDFMPDGIDRFTLFVVERDEVFMSNVPRQERFKLVRIRD